MLVVSEKYKGLMRPLGLFILPWVFYFPAWLKPMAKSDNLVELFQWARFDFESLRHGIDPLWNPYTCSGFPLIGYANTSMYSILSLPQLILPQIFALTIQIMLLHGFAGLGVYLFTRKLGASDDGAFIAGATYSFSGFILQGIQYSYFTAGAAWIGFVFLALENIRTANSTRKSIVWVLIASILLAVQILAGHPQLAIMSGLLYGIYFIWHAVQGMRSHRIRFLGAGMVIVALAIGMTAAIWMPASELLRYSYRENISFDRFVGLSVPPLKLYSNIFLLRMGEYFEYSFWVGVPVALLIWLAIRRKRQESAVKLLIVCLAVSLIMGLGQYTPLFKLLFHVPVMNQLTAPVRWAVDFCFAASCLAAFGWDSMASSCLKRSLERLDLMAIAILTLIALGLASFEGGMAVLNSIPSLMVGIVAVLFMAGKFLSRLWGGRSVALYLSLIIVPGWLVWGGPWFNGADPRPQWAPHWNAIEETIAGNPKARIADFVDLREASTEIVRRLPAHNLNIPNKWSYAVGYQPLMSARYTELMNSDFVGLIGDIAGLLRPRNRALDMLNVKALVIPSDYLKKPESYVRSVVDRKRIEGVNFGESLDLSAAAGERLGFRAPEFMGSVNGVGILSGMTMASEIPQGRAVVELTLSDDGGVERKFILRAGIETAEMMYEAAGAAPENSSTIEGVKFYKNMDLPLWRGNEKKFIFRSRAVSGVALLTYLFNAEGIPQNTAVARVTIVCDDGSRKEYVLRAGVDTSHWTAGIGTQKIAHKVTREAEEFNAGGATGHTFMTILKLDQPVVASAIIVRCLIEAESAGLFLSCITTIDNSGMFAPVELSGIAHDRPAGALSPDGKAGLYLAKWNFPPIAPRWIELRSLLDKPSAGVTYVNAITFFSGARQWSVHPVDIALGNPNRFDLIHQDDLATVYRNKNSLPRAWIAPQSIVLPAEEILKAIQTEILPNKNRFDPLKMALVERDTDDAFDVSLVDAPDEPSVRFEEYSQNRIRLQAETPRRAILVVSETFHPGWQTFVDGKPVPTYQVDYLLRGAMINAGRHSVEMIFRPASARRGRIISFISLAAVLVMLILITISGGRKKEPEVENY